MARKKKNQQQEASQQKVSEPTRSRQVQKLNIPPKSADEIRHSRPTSKRAQAIELMREKDGVSRDELREKFSWTDRDVKDVIRLITGNNGYGIQEDDKNRLHLVEPTAAPAKK